MHLKPALWITLQIKLIRKAINLNRHPGLFYLFNTHRWFLYSLDPDSNADPRQNRTTNIGPLEKRETKYKKLDPRKNRTLDIRPLKKLDPIF